MPSFGRRKSNSQGGDFPPPGIQQPYTVPVSTGPRQPDAYAHQAAAMQQYASPQQFGTPPPDLQRARELHAANAQQYSGGPGSGPPQDPAADAEAQRREREEEELQMALAMSMSIAEEEKRAQTQAGRPAAQIQDSATVEDEVRAAATPFPPRLRRCQSLPANSPPHAHVPLR